MNRVVNASTVPGFPRWAAKPALVLSLSGALLAAAHAGEQNPVLKLPRLSAEPDRVEGSAPPAREDAQRATPDRRELTGGRFEAQRREFLAERRRALQQTEKHILAAARKMKMNASTLEGMDLPDIAIKIKPGPEIEPPAPLLCFGQPGGACILPGKNLGTEVGEVTLNLVHANQTMTLPVYDWLPDAVSFHFPQVEGIINQAAFLRVRTADDRLSNKLPFDFSATEDFQLLPRSAIRMVSCSQAGNLNHCVASNGHYNHDDETQFFEGYVTHDHPDVECPSSLYGSHENAYGTVGDDQGTDVYEITLANGWRVSSYDFEPFVSEAGEAWVENPSPAYPVGEWSYWKPSINWGATPNDKAGYCLYVYVIGPKGVPWQ